MRNIQYKIIKETALSEGLGEYHTFGLQAEEFVDNIPSKVHTLSDVSTEEAVVAEMARLFNDEQLEIVHLIDVVQDML